VARAALRTILGTYLGLKPAEVAFAYNRFGKPSVLGSPATSRLRFNLTHSSDLALCAVAMDREVGIDLETQRQVVDADRMAVRYFDPLEASSYQTLPAEERAKGFLIRWTMKEAVIKGQGQGLSMPLNQFSISADPDALGFHRITSTNPQLNTRWSLRRLTSPDGYVAALAVEGSDWQVVYRRWPEDLEPLIDTNQR
jgi:4'-phosphopantetheinyl transferase